MSRRFGPGLPCHLDQLLDGINKRKTEITQSLASLRFAAECTAESTDSQSVCSLLSASEWATGRPIQNAELALYRHQHYRGEEEAPEGQRGQLASKSSDDAAAAADGDGVEEERKKRKDKKQQQQQQEEEEGNVGTAQLVSLRSRLCWLVSCFIYAYRGRLRAYAC